MNLKRLLPVGLTLAISLAGGLVATFLHMPAALLVGGAVAVSITSLAGFRAEIPDRLRNTAFVVVGMTLGTNVAQDSLSLLPQWPVTIIGLAVALALIVFLSTLLLHHVFGFDWGTSYLSSFPGHLSFVLGMAESGYGDSRQIAVIQSMRILLLTLIVPIFASVQSDADLSQLPTGNELEPVQLVVLILACIAGGFLFRALRIPAAFVLGPMVVATAGKLMGLYDGHLPALITVGGYLVMGGLIGSRFAGTTLREIRHMAVAGTAATMICVGVVSGVALAAAQMVDMPAGQIWLGLAPGALESMGALGLALGFDTAFIAAHHTMRFFFLTLAIPTVAAIARKPPDKGR